MKEKFILSWRDVTSKLDRMSRQIREDTRRGSLPIPVWGIPRGGATVAALLEMRHSNVFVSVSNPITARFAVDDIIDSGETAARVLSKHRIETYALVDLLHAESNDDDSYWYVFPWDMSQDETESHTDAEDLVRRQLQVIGEDPKREGLLETPKRVVRSWGEIFGSYSKEPPPLKWFSSDCDEMVVVRNIEFYSMCEHHMLPFFGTASIAYVPKGKVIGVSKLARLVDYHARKLQIQEKLTEDIANSLKDEVEGVAVSLKAQHMCMTMRGVKQPEPIMHSTCLTGVFRKDAATRNEFLNTT